MRRAAASAAVIMFCVSFVVVCIFIGVPAFVAAADFWRELFQ